MMLKGLFSKTDKFITKELVQEWFKKLVEKVDDQSEKLAHDMNMHIDKLHGKIAALENINEYRINDMAKVRCRLEKIEEEYLPRSLWDKDFTTIKLSTSEIMTNRLREAYVRYGKSNKFILSSFNRKLGELAYEVSKLEPKEPPKLEPKINIPKQEVIKPKKEVVKKKLGRPRKNK